jgi:ubiquitin-conjugating enzyme E2 variant
LPVLDEMTGAQWLFGALSIAAACLLLAALGARMAMAPEGLRWWTPIALVAGMAAADFASGLVHWGADTWGRDDLPVIGPRLLVPFRVHHVNPHDILRRGFVEANGDVAVLAVPLLLALRPVPVETAWGGAVSAFAFAFCGVGMMTNQIHLWAHMPSPPRPVRWLQDCRVILGRVDHAAHHRRPYDGHYCITTGWCNRPLEAIGFFRGLEAVMTTVTGAHPRTDDRAYEARAASARGEHSP